MTRTPAPKQPIRGRKLATAKDAMKATAWALRSLEARKITPTAAASYFRGVGILLKALEVSDIEGRLNRLEELAKLENPDAF
ncbi:hypothetical protein [Geothrix sp.]|jgi:hypothetical protein|uniref:hypothetical protein n=1 Tax=Geothrix sp. TaxID=1962974 RepID=UPI0025BE0D8F|nr:hypothetical protein [Geothrix sp.]